MQLAIVLLYVIGCAHMQQQGTARNKLSSNSFAHPHLYIFKVNFRHCTHSVHFHTLYDSLLLSQGYEHGARANALCMTG